MLIRERLSPDGYGDGKGYGDTHKQEHEPLMAEVLLTLDAQTKRKIRNEDALECQRIHKTA